MIRAKLDPKIGRRIRDRREAIEMNLDVLARRCKIAKSHVSQIENGKKSPSIAVLLRIAKTLGCKASFLLGEKP